MREGGLTDRSRVPQSGNTPLLLAVQDGDAGVAHTLLAAGADKEAKDGVRGGGGLRGAEDRE